MNWHQTIVAALVVAAACCAVMWLLEDFRQRKMIGELKDWLDTLPTAGEAPS